MTPWSHRLSLLSLVLSPALSAHAAIGLESFTGQPGTILSAEIQLSDFRYSLVDLDLADGIAPSITFLPADAVAAAGRYAAPKLNAFGSSYVYGRSAALPALPGTPTSVTSTDGLSAAAAGPDFISNASRMDAASAVSKAEVYPLHYTNQTHVAQARSSANAIHGVYFDERIQADVTFLSSKYLAAPQIFEGSLDNVPRFLLSPHTQVVFEGELSAKVDVDVSQYTPADTRAYPSADGDGFLHPYVSVLSFGNFSIARADQSAAFDTLQAARDALDFQRVNVHADAFLEFGLDGKPLDGGSPILTEARKQAFRFTLSNDDDKVLTGMMHSQLTSAIVVSTPVPEPSAWALFFAGLAVAGRCLAHRRLLSPQA